MRTSKLLKANLSYYWRTNLAMLLGVAIAVAVLAGALLVGDSVKASLRDLFLQRLGNTDYVVTAQGFVREQLAAEITNHPQFATGGFASTCPLIAIEGSVTNDANKQVGSRIRVYGVDEKFWSFHGRANPALQRNEILLSEALARELDAHAGNSIVLRVAKPSAIPIESLHSRKEDLGTTVRLAVRGVLAPDALGEFSLQPEQGSVRAVFVPLRVLQTELDQSGKVNLVLVDERNETRAATAGSLESILKDVAAPEDYGIKLRVLNEQQALSVESFAGLIPGTLAEEVERASLDAQTSGAMPFLSYLINGIRRDDGRELPYSIVTGVTNESMELMQHDEYRHLPGCGESETAQPPLPQILLTEWAGSDLQVKPGDHVTLDYYVWLEEGKLATRSTEFRVACVIPMARLALDRDLVPDYPGITESETLGDWDPPFPIDLKRIRPQDEDYWKKYRTAPKAFVSLDVAQDLWQSRFGKFTSLRLWPKSGATLEQAKAAFEQSLRATLEPTKNGFAILAVRAQGLEASQGATDFGEYFLYFSFFLVVSALMLAALFFKLGIEQRLREIGLLRAVGFPPRKIRSLFLIEGMTISAGGALLGIAGALAYAQLMMIGLKTWWVDAVGTTMLRLHVAPLSLLLGFAGGILAAFICIVWTLRRTGKQSARSLLSGILENVSRRTRRRTEAGKQSTRWSVWFGTTFGIGAVALLIASALNYLGQVAGFFGGGTMLLIALLCFQSAWLRRAHHNPINGSGWWPIARLGFRSATSRPGRSVLCIALIASAAFIIVAVDAFRHREGAAVLDKKSGTGGYPLLAESLLPIVHDLNQGEGRSALNLTTDGPLADVSFARFRVRPGDDASCLNLYRPANPKVLGLTPDFINSNRFKFQNSLAASSEEHNNPWLLLNRKFDDGAIPVLADANSMTYVLHLKPGDDFVMNLDSGPVRLRFVGSLGDSIFQSQLLMSEENFVRLFPEQQGYRFFLIDTPSSAETASLLEDRLSDFGFDVAPTSERLANFHRVENTYLSTFQMLGGLGLLLGTLGMAAVLLRNVLERRRELALLRAVGYNSGHFTLMVVAENVLLLLCGLLTGCFCAFLAIAPVFVSRQAQLPGAMLGVLLVAVLLSGLTASIIATWAALRAPLLPALRAE